MNILAIDPGTEQSGWLVYDQDQKAVNDYGQSKNVEILNIIDKGCTTHCSINRIVVEDMTHTGMPVGKEVFETCKWMGRFEQMTQESFYNHCFSYLGRREVKIHLCGTVRAKDANIRQALIDKFGGKEKAIGNKKNPGPLYGIKSHLWSALALAVTYAETMKGE